MVPRLSGFTACKRCGKLVIASDQQPDPAVPTATASAPAVEGDEAVTIPDFMEVETGWRAWGVNPTIPVGGVPLLQSVSFSDSFWLPREAMEAECEIHKDTDTIPHAS